MNLQLSWQEWAHQLVKPWGEQYQPAENNNKNTLIKYHYTVYIMLLSYTVNL